MIRAAADFLAEVRIRNLRAGWTNYIAHIAAAAARRSDGYLNTYTQMKEPATMGSNGGNDLWQHDLYNAGCLVDAAVHTTAHRQDRTAHRPVKLSNYMCLLMGPPPAEHHSRSRDGEEAMVGLFSCSRSSLS